MSWMILALYYLILGMLACYGVHRLILVWTFWRRRRGASSPPPDLAAWPMITVQLPVFNEMYVVARLIDAVCALDYPRDRLEIQVLDDSTDETRQVVADRVDHYRRAGVDIHHLHRADRRGFKAGALAAGLEAARGELIAIFDADFIPPVDFLKRSVPQFCDPEIGMVQARWGHINRDASLLTKVQAIMLDGHFVVEHAARHLAGCFFNFNGTAGVWRRKAIDDAGGWEHDTLTEDLDLSYRAQLKGWRFSYLSDLVVPAELPEEINAYKSQQRRWAKGSIQTGRKLLVRVLKAPISPRAKLEALVHLTNNSAYPLMLLLSLLVFPAMKLRLGTEWWLLLAVDLPLFLAATVSFVIFYAVSQRASGGPWRRLWQLPALMGVGIGLAVNNSRAVLAGFWQRGGVFQRTPKQGHGGQSRLYKLPTDISFYVEAIFSGYFFACFGLAVAFEMWMSIPFLYLFLYGYTYIFLLSVLPARS